MCLTHKIIFVLIINYINIVTFSLKCNKDESRFFVKEDGMVQVDFIVCLIYRTFKSTICKILLILVGNHSAKMNFDIIYFDIRNILNLY